MHLLSRFTEPLQGLHQRKPEDWREKQGGRDEIDGGRVVERESERGGVGKKSSDSEGSSDSRILSHRRGGIVQEDKRV